MPKQAIVSSSLAVHFIDTPSRTKEPGGRHQSCRRRIKSKGLEDTGVNWDHNSGDDMAGIIHAVGQDVYQFKPGDRVAALHQTGTENGSYAEYAVAPAWTAFHIPATVSFEEASTIPLAALTAALALYADMRLPAPYHVQGSEGSPDRTPLLIYGVASAVGAYAAKLARLSGISPIIVIAGRASGLAETLADYLVDYRAGEDELVAEVERILSQEGQGNQIRYVFDAVSENGSLETTLRLLDPNSGVVSTVLPPKLFAKDGDKFEYPPGVTAVNTAVPKVHSIRKDFGYLWSQYLGRLLEDGRLKGHPYQVIPGGLNGIATGLRKLKNGEASGVKYVYRIEETGNDISSPPRAGVDGGNVSGTHPLENFPFPSG
ncbi:putative alcohol dehydrogenase [Xylariomycetidae sp. FL2044]|nr:putative alcohol dehydrogenase [Xylariomycetidae sp. FL2044]